MNFSVIIPAVLLGLLALGIIGYLLKAFVGPLVQNPLAYLERWHLKKKERFISGLSDEAFEAKLLRQQCPPETIFFLESLRYNRDMIRFVNFHNLAVLNRLLNVCERRGFLAKNIGLIEELFQSRGELLDSLFKARETHESARSKLKTKGQRMPQWGDQEFEKKLVMIGDQVATNRRNIERQLLELFKSFDSLSGSDGVVYH